MEFFKNLDGQKVKKGVCVAVVLLAVFVLGVGAGKHMDRRFQQHGMVRDWQSQRAGAMMPMQHMRQRMQLRQRDGGPQAQRVAPPQGAPGGRWMMPQGQPDGATMEVQATGTVPTPDAVK